MFETRIPLEEGQRLTLVEMAQDVAIDRWDEADVLIRLRDGQGEDLTIEQREAGPAVSARVACEVLVPSNVPVNIRQALANLKVGGISDLNAEQVRGNLKMSKVDEAVIAEVYGNLKASKTSSLRVVGTVYGNSGLNGVANADLQNVRGNLQVKAADHLRASRIGGNLQAKSLRGSLDADRVGGNALLKGVGGPVAVDQVAGNLVGKNLTGGAKVPRIGGNLALNGEIGMGCTYHFKADGNATLRLPEEANAHLTLVARGKTLSSVTLADQQQDGTRLTGKMGNGGAEIVVEAEGNVLLAGGLRPVATGLGEEISRQVEESLRAIDLEAIGQQVSEEMEAAMTRLRVKLEGVDWERIGHRTQDAVQQAMERMRRDMDRMVEKATRHQERVERRAEWDRRRAERLHRRTRGAPPHQPDEGVDAEAQDWQVEGAPDGAEPELNLDEERLSILRMVEQGQISPEDAEMLLDALQAP
jgi:hypothetical protein